MAVTKDQLEVEISANTKALTDALNGLKKSATEVTKSVAGLNEEIKAGSKTEEQYASAVKKGNQASIEAEKIYGSLSQTLNGVKSALEQTQGVVNSMDMPAEDLERYNSALNALVGTMTVFQQATNGIITAKKIFDGLFNPQMIELVNKLLIILQAYATINGFGKLADSIEEARKKLNLFAEAASKFRENFTSGIIESIDNTAMLSKIFLSTIAGIKTAIVSLIAVIAGISGFSIFQTWLKDGLNFSKMVSGIGETFKNVFANIGDFVQKAKDSFIALSQSLPNLYKGMGILGYLFSTLGSSLNDSHVASLAFVNALNGAGVAFLAMSIAIKVVLHQIGSFIEAIGDKLIVATDAFAEKFAKSQQIVSQFGFIVENFGAAYGTNFIGSLRQWEDQIESLAKTTTFSSNDIRKATKLIIAENKALGMSYEDNIKFLNRAVEIASSSGLELIDVVQRLQSGLMGNSQAVAALGINLSSHALEHSKLNQTINKTVATMSAQEKQQIALAEIYSQTEPLIGAAIKQGETIIGINQKIANSYGAIQSKLGSVNVLSIALSSTYADFLKILEKMPDSLFTIAGSLIDILGVTLKVIGVTIQYLLLIGTLITAYKLLNAVLVTNVAIQNLLSTTLGKVGIQLGLNIGKIADAKILFQTLGNILKGGLLLILANTASAIGIITVNFIKLSAALLMNPVFLGSAAAIIGTIALVKALKELNDELEIIDITTIEFSGTLANLRDSLGAVATGGVLAFNSLIQGIKISIISLAELGHYLMIARAEISKFFNPRGAEEYNKTIDAAREKLDLLIMAHERGLDAIAEGFSNATGEVQMHAKMLKVAADATEELNFKQAQLTKAYSEVDFATIRIDVLGREVEKLTNKYTIATKNVEKFSKQVLASTEVDIEAIKNYQKAIEDQAQAAAQLDKLRIDSLKGISDTVKQVQKDALKYGNDETQSIKAEFDERRKAVKDFEEALAGLGPIAGESASKIITAYQEIDKAQAKAIAAAKKKKEEEGLQEELRQLREQLDLIKSITDKNLDLSRILNEDRLGVHEQITANLKDEIAVIDEQIARYKIMYIDNVEILSLLDKQKKLLIEVGEVQKKNTDKSFLDWVHDLGQAITEAFGRKNIDSFFKYVRQQIDDLRNSDIVINIRRVVSEATESPTGKAIGSAIDKTVDIAKKAGNVLYQAGGAVASALVKAGGWIGGIIDVFMNADKYLKVLIEFPKQFLETIKNLPALMQQFIDTFPKMIRAIAEALPGIVLKLIDMVPEFVAAFIDALPTLIERIAEIIPEVFLKIVAMMPKLIELFVKGTAKMIQGFIKGLIRGLGRILTGAKIPKVKIDTRPLQDAAKKLSNNTSRLFDVKDLLEAAEDPLKKITDDVKEAFDKGRNWIKEVWQWVKDRIIQPILDGLKAVWLWVYKLISPIIDAIKEVWLWVWNNVLSPIVGLVKDAFKFVLDIFESLATIVFKAFEFVQTLWNSLSEVVSIAFKFVKDLWEELTNAVSIAFKFVKDLWNELTEAVSIAFKFVKDLWNGLTGVVSIAFKFVKDLWDALVNVVKSAFESPKALWEALKNVVEVAFKFVRDLWENLSNTVQKSFQFVKDLWDNFSATVQIAFQFVKDLWDNFSGTVQRAFQFVKDLWDNFAGTVQRAFQFVKDLWDNFAGTVQKAFQFVKDLWDNFAGTVQKAFQFVKDIFNNLANYVDNAFAVVRDIFQGLSNTVKSAFGWIIDNVITPFEKLGQKIAEPVSKIFDGVKNFFGAIGNMFTSMFKLDFSGIKTAVTDAFNAAGQILKDAFGAIVNPIIDVFNGLIDVINALKIGPIGWSISAGKLGKWSGDLIPEIDLVPGDIGRLQRFAQGGLVLGPQILKGLGTDTVPVAATPGEFIMKRSTVQSVGVGNLQALNSGAGIGERNIYNMSFEINIDAKTNLDESYIRATLIPRMSDELKRASLDGKFVLSSKGIR